MKRRQALIGIGGITLGAFLFQSCQNEPSIALSNLTLNKGDWTSILYFSKMILPINGDEKSTDNDRIRYVLTALDQTYKKERIELFHKGLSQIRAEIKEKYKASPKSMESVPLIEYWQKYIETSSNETANAVFLTELKNLLVQNYTTSKTFLEGKMNYSFLPGTYQGCISIDQL